MESGTESSGGVKRKRADSDDEKNGDKGKSSEASNMMSANDFIDDDCEVIEVSSTIKLLIVRN